MNAARPTIAVYIVTYRRHQMLKRAIKSVLAQTHSQLCLRVVNDDPADEAVGEIVDSFHNPRVTLFHPVEKRGATRNFNLVFQERDAPFSALLEDDNWWEPTFLESQLRVLESHSDSPIVVGNERIWEELPQNQWQDTGRTIWPFQDVRTHEVTLESLCGGSTLCNSSMLVRTSMAAHLLTPDFIPADVTEHYRERLMPMRFPLNGEALTNYAKTLSSARRSDETWGRHQTALIGSIFIALGGRAKREALARSLWRGAVSPLSPRATTLVSVGLALSEARPLLGAAPTAALARAALHYARNPNRMREVRRLRGEMGRELDFLSAAPVVRDLVEKF
jgi:glycosyltransferase involved in cell wall biosynthesis